MKLFNKVAIVGTGLIGGSLALDIKRNKLANIVVGVSKHKKSLTQALKHGAIDSGSQDIAIIKGADLVILATPVQVIIDLAPAIAKLIAPQAIVTDVGSTKEEITRKLSRIFPCFIGSHPLAGSEKRGIEFANPGLFKNSLCIVTPLEGSDKKALAKVILFWKKVGARLLILSPKEHDMILSYISHLPHAVSFSLINSVKNSYLGFAPNSLREITRVAASDSRLWADIFLSNRKNVLKAISILQHNLSNLSSAICKNDSHALVKLLKEAKAKREYLDKLKKAKEQ